MNLSETLLKVDDRKKQVIWESLNYNGFDLKNIVKELLLLTPGNFTIATLRDKIYIKYGVMPCFLVSKELIQTMAIENPEKIREFFKIGKDLIIIK